MKKYKIGIDAQAIGTNFSGNEVYIKNVIKHFQLENDIDYIVYLNKNYSYNGELLTEFDNKRIFKFRTPFLRLPVEFPVRIKNDKLDLLHVQYTAPIFTSCPIVTTIHDISFEHYPEYFTKKEIFFLKRGVRKTALESTKIVTVSEYSKNDIIKTYNIPAEKIKVTYNSIDPSFYEVSDVQKINRVKVKYGIEGAFILAVGNLQPRKNIPRLLEAYKLLRLENPSINTKLVIVGRRAWLYEEIFKIMKDYKFLGDVILTDYVPKDDLPLLYNAAKVFIYPSIFEGFGLPVIEAMACGTPVVTSNTSCLPEVVGDAAVLVNPLIVNDIAGGLYSLLTNKELYENLKLKGLEKAKCYSWEKTSLQTAEIYKEILY